MLPTYNARQGVGLSRTQSVDTYSTTQDQNAKSKNLAWQLERTQRPDPATKSKWSRTLSDMHFQANNQCSCYYVGVLNQTPSIMESPTHPCTHQHGIPQVRITQRWTRYFGILDVLLEHDRDHVGSDLCL